MILRILYCTKEDQACFTIEDDAEMLARCPTCDGVFQVMGEAVLPAGCKVVAFHTGKYVPAGKANNIAHTIQKKVMDDGK